MADGTGKSGTRHCHACGRWLRPGVRFCPGCGQTVPEDGGAGAGPPTASSLAIREPARTDTELEAGPPVQRRPSRRPRPSSPRPDYGPAGGRRVIIAAGVFATATAIALVFLLGHPFRHAQAAAATASSHNPAPTRAVGSDSPMPSTTPTDTEQQAATGLAALLAQSGSDRQEVNNAFNDVSQCGPGLASDAQTFSAAAASRHQLLQELNQIPGLSTLPTAMISDLTSAWQVSATVDDDYVDWAQDQAADGCSTGTSDPNYEAAEAPNLQATSTKTAFVNLWNPLAQQYDLTTYAQGDI
jgi:hypothetical protein